MFIGHTQPVTTSTSEIPGEEYSRIIPVSGCLPIFVRVAVQLFGSKIFILLFEICLPVALTLSVAAQRQPVAPRYGVPTLVQLNRNSGYIFVGTVKSVTRVEPTSPTGVAAIRITFHVENALRGVKQGQTLVIREWAGRWESGERYRVGERIMLFLFPPGKLGLTSPVGGELGKFQLDEYGHVLLNREQVAAVEATPALAVPGQSRMTWRQLSNGVRRASQE